TPGSDFTGSDSFPYKTRDGVNDSNVATVTIAVLQENNNPVAINDYYNTDKDTPINVPARGVLANDADIDTPAANLTAALITGPTRAASFTLDSDGSFDYTPVANFTGTDSFTYKANDGTNDSNFAMVTIAVLPLNNVLVAKNDTENGGEDMPLSIPAPGVLTNDTGAPIANLTATVVSGPRRALSFTLNADGSYSYIGAQDFNGFDTYTYRITDGTRVSNVAMVNIELLAINDVAEISDQFVTTNEDTPVTITLSATDVDNQSLSFNIATSPSRGSLGAMSAPSCTVRGQGSTCTATVSYTPSLNLFGADSFTFTVTDGPATTPSASVSITVAPVNDAPTANAGSLSISE
ncbi:MAG: tandem-95 repeat protein, partial [bacterium]